MSSVGELITKSKRALAEGGVKGFLRRSRNYVIYQVAKMRSKNEMKDYLFVNGCTLPHPERYRVDHQMEQLEANGLTADKILYTDVDPAILKFYRGVIIFRCPITPSVKKLIEKAHYYNKTVFYDIDDLVMDKKYTDKIKYVSEMSKEDKAIYDDGVERMGETMKMCDYCITTTTALAEELKKYGKEVFVNKNVASEEMMKLSLEAKNNVKRNDERVRVGYLSGSITHNPDFEMVKPALIKIMDEFPQVDLCVMGHLGLPEEFERFGGRVVKMPFGDWRRLPEVIAKLDINLAPIEESIFNAAKSENKWTEAALCEVVTVASDFGAFKEVIADGETGVLCKSGDEWYEKLKTLIMDTKLRKKIAHNAYNKAKKEYLTTYSGRGLAKFLESKMARNIAFVLPSTNISGGVNVVLKHCDILRRNGWDAMVVNMDKSDDNFVSSFGEVNVVSAVKHEISAKFDVMVATLFTTLKYIKEYPDAKRKLYLVQNFETDFNDYGSPARKEANATYTNGEDIEYITISKWCKNWLEKDFGQKVKYAPNGINLDDFKWRERDLGREKVRILIEGNSDDYYKNVDESFKIVEKLDRDNFEIVYLSYQGEPKKWYKVDKFYHKVPHEEVGRVYRECDILLKTSILESFSYPPLEMMATGGYIVAVPNGGNKEYLKDEENCLFYAQGNIDEAVRHINEILNNEKLRRKLMAGARKTAKSRDWRDIESKILELYA